MVEMSKSKISWVRSLSIKKYRDREQVFVAEGVKLVGELLPLLPCRLLVVTDMSLLFGVSLEKVNEVVVVGQKAYEKLTSQPSPQGVLGVFEQMDMSWSVTECIGQLNLLLDDVQDPGNLGTIIRLCDWFGIRQIFCSKHTVDVYNPKTIQATMGAISRVRICYVDKVEFLAEISTQMTIFGTYMEGESIYKTDLTQSGMLVMGNEGRGISQEVTAFVDRKISIPRMLTEGIPPGESLNVGIATAVVVSEFRRRAMCFKK